MASRSSDLVAKRTSGLMQPQLKDKIEKATRKQFPEGIAAYGTDALRFTLASLAGPSRDINFDLGRVGGYRNFCNKLWNAARFVLMTVENARSGRATAELSVADRWIVSRLADTLAQVDKALTDYRFDFAATALYEFTWYEFCDWYLELTKPVLQGDDTTDAQKRGTRRTLVTTLEALLRALHPLMPFITEEIWQTRQAADRAARGRGPIRRRIGRPTTATPDMLMVASYPAATDFAADAEAEGEVAWMKQFILAVRQIRGEMDIAPSRKIPLLLQNASPRDAALATKHGAYLTRLAGPRQHPATGAGRNRTRIRHGDSRRAHVAGTDGGPDRPQGGDRAVDEAHRQDRIGYRQAQRQARQRELRAQRAAGRGRGGSRTRGGTRSAEGRPRLPAGTCAPHGPEWAIAEGYSRTVTSALHAALLALDKVILGKSEAVRLALACLLARGHLLIEDVPGVGKTTLAHALAHVLGLAWQRVQFTSDLLPADIIGVSVFDATNGSFTFRKGPMFTQLLLADEVNRASPKTQSALLEAMEERQVSVDVTTYRLPDPFFVVATQNPFEQLGTFGLPESQLDRFLMRISLGYPDAAHERVLLAEGDRRDLLAGMPPALNPEAVRELQAVVQRVHVAPALLEYVQALLASTRRRSDIQIGLSPRAGQGLTRAARAWAMLAGRDMVLPEDVQAVFAAVASHRLESAGVATAADHAAFIAEIARGVPVPV